MFARCASLRPPLNIAAVAGAGVTSRTLARRRGQQLVWHSCTLRWATQLCESQRALHAPASRVREVETACAALVESIEAGDGAWFERIVVQLREVLAEQHAAVSSQSIALSAKLPTAVVDDTKLEVPLWRQKLHTLQSMTAGMPSQAIQPRQSKMEKPPLQSVTAGMPSQASQPRQSKMEKPLTQVRKHDLAAEEPAWLRALQLLEKAAQTPPQRESAELQRQSHESEVSDDDSGLGDYLASFEEQKIPRPPYTPPKKAEKAAVETEPAWVKTLRMLEAAALPNGNAGTSSTVDHEHAEEDVKMDRYTRLLNDRDFSADSPQEQSKRGVRMSRYAEMLKEADSIGKNTAPGGSVPPLRFPSSVPSQPKTSSPLGPFPTTASTSSASTSSPLPPPPPPQKEAKRPKKKTAADDTLSQAVGRGNLASSIPTTVGSDDRDDAVLRKEDFVWSEHEFNQGEKDNKRVLRTFRAEFKKMAAETPDGLRDSKLLTAALDLALACVKCYELDKADAIYRRAIGECRRRGMPWDVKCIQDMATLRCKQHRQADAAELLEELATKAPPHPATFVNLGTVYNQLRMYEKAEVWFRQAVNLKGGTPGRDDLWNIGIAKKNQKFYDEALPMLEQALAEFQEHEPDHPVTIAKLHSSVAGCLHEMGRPTPAIDQYQQAYDLYVKSVGKSSPLFCSTAEGLAKALRDERRYMDAFKALMEAFEVHAKGDAVHPTPLFEGLELALELHDKEPQVPLHSFPDLIEAGLSNLESRGQIEDGNAGLVMTRGAKVLSRLGSAHVDRALQLLHRGVGLVKQSHEAGDANLSHEIMEGNMLMRRLETEKTGQVTETSQLATGSLSGIGPESARIAATMAS